MPKENQADDPAAIQDPDEALEEELETGQQQESDDPASEESAASEEQTFYDVKKVPEELRPSFKEMQKAFTQKTQAIATQEKQLSESMYKAQVFDQLMANPDVVEYLESLRAGQPPRGQTAEQSLPEDLDPQIGEFVNNKVSALENQIQVLQGQLEVQREVEAFKQRHPDWKDYEDEMREIWRENTNLPPEAVYKWAIGNRAASATQTAARRTRTKAASVETPGTGSPARRKRQISNFQEAVDAACEEHGLKKEDFTFSQSYEGR